jgi:hypothetical protein
MRKESLLILIRHKLNEGSLPQDSMPRVWGASANGDFCDACDQAIPADEYVIEGIWFDGDGKRGLQFHVQCFSVWDEERGKTLC